MSRGGKRRWRGFPVKSPLHWRVPPPPIQGTKARFRLEMLFGSLRWERKSRQEQNGCVISSREEIATSRGAISRATWPAGQLAAVHAAGDRQRFCGRDGGPRTQHRAAARPPGVRPGVDDGGALLHHELRGRESAGESLRGSPRRSYRTQGDLGDWLAGRAASAVVDYLRSLLGLGGLRQCPARHQPGPLLVHHRHYEDRPGG